MPVMDGLQATRQILGSAANSKRPRVLMLTTFDLDDYVYEALRAGASGFLLKDATAAELVHAVRVVAAGDALLAPAVTRRLIADFARQPRPDPPFPATLGVLTHRESEVLRLIARGLSNTEISDTLVIAQQTTKTYVGRILAKLYLRDRAQAVVLAYESGLVTPGSSSPARARTGRAMRPLPPQTDGGSGGSIGKPPACAEGKAAHPPDPPSPPSASVTIIPSPLVRRWGACRDWPSSSGGPAAACSLGHDTSQPLP